jgi:hypothetical protein
VLSFLLVFPLKSFIHYSSLHACYIFCPFHPPWLHQCNYISRKVQVMNLLVMQVSPTSCYFIPLRSKQSSQHLVPTNFPAFYGTQKCIVVFKRVRYWSIILSQKNVAHNLESYFSEMHFNIILSPTPTYFTWSLFFPYDFSLVTVCVLRYMQHFIYVG